MGSILNKLEIFAKFNINLTYNVGYIQRKNLSATKIFKKI